MYYVYVLESIMFSEKMYVGYTINLKERFNKHNTGGSVHTAQYRPWKLIAYMGFSDQKTAWMFEKYLKSQSGRAFARKRFFAKEQMKV